MSNTTETAEADTGQNISFSVLRRDSETPIGPISDSEILQMLNENKLSPEDYVFFDGMTEWKPLSEVFVIEEQISHFVDDGQDKGRVGHIFREVSNILTEGDDIYYIAIQERAGILSKAKAGVVLTGKYIFIVREIRTGWEIESHQWQHVSNTLMRDEGKGLGVFSVLLDLEKKIDVPHIPLKQLRRLFQLSQEMREMEVAMD